MYYRDVVMDTGLSTSLVIFGHLFHYVLVNMLTLCTDCLQNAELHDLDEINCAAQRLHILPPLQESLNVNLLKYYFWEQTNNLIYDQGGYISYVTDIKTPIINTFTSIQLI